MHIFNRYLRTGHRRKANERANLNHVGQHTVFGTIQTGYPFNGKQIRTNARNFGTHAVQHFAKLLQIRFAGGVVNSGGALG